MQGTSLLVCVWPCSVILTSLKPPKKPVVLKKSVNGFLVNRLQYALLQEAWRLVEVSLGARLEPSHASASPRFKLLLSLTIL